MLLVAGAGWAQDAPLDPRSSVAINFPSDSPVTLVSADIVNLARGRALGAAVPINEVLAAAAGGTEISPDLRLIVYGLALTLVVLFMPGGLAQAARLVAHKLGLSR